MTEQTEVFKKGSYTFERWLDGWVQILVDAIEVYEGFEKDIPNSLLENIERSKVEVVATKRRR